MTTFTIEYKNDPHDDWSYSVLNEDGPFPDIVAAIKGLFTNAVKLSEKFLNVPHNEYRIVDNEGEQCIYYTPDDFRKVLEHFIAKTESIDQFEVET